MKTKKPWQSKTLWGGLIMMFAMFSTGMGWTDGITDADQSEMVDSAVNVIDSVVAFIGFVMVWWGRVTAGKRIALTGGG